MSDFISKLNIDQNNINLFKIQYELDNIVNLLIFKIENEIELFEKRHNEYYKQYEQVSENLLPMIEQSLQQMKRIIFIRINYVINKLNDMKKSSDGSINNELIENINNIIKVLRKKEDYLLNNR